MLATLGKYVDSLYLSVSVDFPDRLRNLFSAAKEDARGSGDNLVDFCAAAPGVPGGRWYISPMGKGRSQYVIQNGCFWVGFCVWDNMPTLNFQFKADCLYEYEPEQYAALVDNVVRQFFGSAPYEAKVSRFDFAADFQMEGFKLPAVEDVSCRARYRRVEYDGKRGNTLTLGRRNQSLQSQIYCKSEELLKSDKAWMFDVWRASGNYRDDLPVWRAEMRFYRDGLRSFGISTVDELFASLADLVAYSLGGDRGVWLRVHDADSRDLANSSRRPSASWWAVLSEFFVSGLTGIGRKRAGYDPNPSMDRLIKVAGSMLAGAAALHRFGYDTKTPLDPVRFFAWVGWQYQKRLAMNGETWPERVNLKTAGLRAVAYG